MANNDQEKIDSILSGIQNNRVRTKALESAYALLMKRQNMGALDEPYLLFGALMAEILTLQSRVEKLEGNNA